MKLIDLWKLGDLTPFKMFIKCDAGVKEVLDGPGFPVVDGRDASDLEVKSMRPASYSMYGNVLEVFLVSVPETAPVEKNTMTISDTQARTYFDIIRKMQHRDSRGDYRQWIADVYHCSECWGQKMTELEMLLDLAESRRQADPDDYVPDITLYHECMEYWNELCDAHPGE